MFQLVKLARNGNGTTIGLTRALQRYLGWVTGEHVMLVANENKTLTVVRVTRESILEPYQPSLAEPEPEHVEQ